MYYLIRVEICYFGACFVQGWKFQKPIRWIPKGLVVESVAGASSRSVIGWILTTELAREPLRLLIIIASTPLRNTSRIW